MDDVKSVISSYIELHKQGLTKETWFEEVKKMAEGLGYQVNMKEYKANPDAYKGSIADVTGIIRVAITNRQNTPDIFVIMDVLGSEKSLSRLEKVLSI